jgi:hypothetical protein
VVPPIGTPLLARSTMPHAAMLELVPSSLDSPPPPLGTASTSPCWVTPAVPPGFLPRAASATPAAPHAASAAPVTPCAARTTPTSPAQHPGPPPQVRPSSPITYVCRPRRPAAPVAPALLTSTPAHRPVTVVPMTPLVNPHRMVTRAKAAFWMPQDSLVLTATTIAMPPSLIPTSVCVALAEPNWCAAMEEEYRALLSNGT